MGEHGKHRPLVAALRIMAICAALGGSVLGAQAQCRQALALGLDVSRSVDAQEYRLQLDGLATALQSEDVRDAILASIETPIALFVYEWSDPTAQRVILPWTQITGAETLNGVAARLANTTRAGPNDPEFSADTPGQIGARTGSTGLGAAMEYAWYAFRSGPDCWKRTLDISGDGPNNSGIWPGETHERLASDRVTVNALVVAADPMQIGDARQAEIKELSSYFRSEVILGADAFVEAALGYVDYQRAMTRKLLRELQVFALGELPQLSNGPIRVAERFSTTRRVNQ